MGKTITYDKDEFKALFDQGLTYEEIGNHFGAGPTWVCRTVKALGIKRKKEPVKVTWDITPNGAIDDNVRKLVDKRNGILIRFLETGDTSEAKAYCAKYKVPMPESNESFRRYLKNAAERVKAMGATIGASRPKRKRRGGKLKKFTKEQLQALIEKGLYCDEIAKELNCAQTTVWLWRRKYGLPYPARRKPVNNNTWTRLDRDVLKNLCDQKLTISKIADHFGVGPNIVRRNIAEYGIERKSLRQSSNVDKDQLRKMVEEDRMTQKQIAEALGCSVCTVGILVKKYGYNKPKKEVIQVEKDDLQQVREVSMVPRAVKRMPVRRLQRRKRRGGKRA